MQCHVMRFLTLLIFAIPANLLADGGAVILHKEVAAYTITVFASPVPPRAGMIDLSVLIQSNESLDPELDADVSFDLSKGSANIHVPASRGQAQNKLLYAAAAHLHDSGDWHLTATVTRARKSVTASGILAVGAEPPKLAAYRGYIALPFLCLAIFLLHQWLRSRLRLRTGH